LLAFAILLLEQHYFVDLVAAFPTAAAAMALIEWPFESHRRAVPSKGVILVRARGLKE